MPNMDWHLNELYGFLENSKANIISTSKSRYVIDVNRAPDINLFGNFRSSLIYDRNTWGEEIYAKPPTESELNTRVKKYYIPYHEALDEMVKSALTFLARRMLSIYTASWGLSIVTYA